MPLSRKKEQQTGKLSATHKIGGTYGNCFEIHCTR